MRSAPFVAVMLLASAPGLTAHRPQFYGPKQGMMGEGYKQKLQDDGSWRIVTEYHTSDPSIAVDVALYRAAELARDAGKPYVQILSGYGSSQWYVASGFVYARPSESPAAPADCRAKACYTADVAKVMYILGGPAGDEPGVARPTSVDERGRPVTVSGFGTGATAWTKR